MYEANIIFGNIDQLVPVNEAFLQDLEKLTQPGGEDLVGGVGDVAWKHFKELKGFENYRAYISRREDAQDAFRKVTAKKLAGGSKTTFETFTKNTAQ